VDPGLTRGGEITTEVVKMSSMQFGDGTMFNTADPSEAPVEAQHAAPLQPIQPLVPPVAPEVAPVVPVAPVEPLAAPASAPVPARSEPPAPMAVGDMRDVPLGTLVFRAGLLPEERLEEALQEGMKTGRRLGEVLLERGWVSQTDLGRLLAGQKGLPFVELDPAAIDPTAPPLLHPEKARLHGALPVGFEGGVPVVAVADPSNDLVIENVRRALACDPVLVVAGRDALLRAINESYGGATVEAQAPPAETQPAVEPAPLVEPVAEPVAPVVPVMPPVAAEPQAVEPVDPQVPVVPEPLAVHPVESQASEGAGVWAPQPEPTAEPVAQVVAAEPVAVAPVPSVLPQREPVVQAEPEQALAPAVAEPVPAPAAEANWTVVVRLTDGERIEVGAFPGKDEAFEGARAVVAQIGTDGTWPFFAGRFIRPESIVSVDLVELEVSRWLGSQAGAAALGPDQQS